MIYIKKWVKTLLFIGLGLLNLFLVNKFNIDGTLGYLMTCLGIFFIAFAFGIKEFISGIIFGVLI